MSSVLESVEWGKASIQFLDSINKYIDKEKPATVYLRHSKADYSNVKSPKDGVLTKQGLKTSYEFGKKLPQQYKYRIYHSPYPRAINSAEHIHQGITEHDTESKIIGAQEYLMFPEEYEEKVMELFEVYGWNGFVKHWVNGRFDEKVISSLDIAQKASANIMENLVGVKPGSIDLYVNHDIIIVPLMFHWFGVLKEYGYIGHLDGFILQLYDGYMIYYDKEGKHKVAYPSWWNP